MEASLSCINRAESFFLDQYPLDSLKRNGNPKAAFDQLKDAALGGDRLAKFYIGLLCEHGLKNASCTGMEKAVAIYKELHRKDFAPAIARLAFIYLKTDPELAVDCFIKAGYLEDSISLFCLGLLRIEGVTHAGKIIMHRDAKEGKRLILRARGLGNAFAEQFRL